MERIKSFKWIIVPLILVYIIIIGVASYLNYLDHKTYDYKGVFVIEDKFRGGIDGHIYKDC